VLVQLLRREVPVQRHDVTAVQYLQLEAPLTLTHPAQVSTAEKPPKRHQH
jgi:hypothetical protein